MAVDADAVPLGPASRDYRFDHVFHFVRHPLTAIPSIAAADLSDESWEFIRKYVPYRSDEPAVLKSTRYWYHWNCAAQSKAECTFRVEDLDQLCLCLREHLGIHVDADRLRNIPTSVNTRRLGKSYHRIEELLLRLRLLPAVSGLATTTKEREKKRDSLTWEELRALDPQLAGLVQEKAREYGYGV